MPGRAAGLLVAALVVSACSAGVRPEILQAWVGRPAAALEREWGVATREIRDGETRILVYEELDRSMRQPPPPPAAGRQDPYNTQQAAEPFRRPAIFVRSYLFWVDAEGTIVQAEMRKP